MVTDMQQNSYAETEPKNASASLTSITTSLLNLKRTKPFWEVRELKTLSEYERLRSWYLARLRKLSLENVAAQGLTPASLIQADRENIEKIILKSQARNYGEKSRKQLGVNCFCISFWY